MKWKNRAIESTVMLTEVRSIEKCRAIVFRICSLSVVLVSASLQSFAATPVEVTEFGSNPGNLRMFKYIPDQVPDSAPLIVVMHGCRQNARTFARESGWIHLADKLHLALAMPEQTQANNLSNCFNWFQPNNITRDQGEAMSIKQMVDKMKLDHNIDPKRIYVTGLSAGGAMTSVMLATYPDVFAGGAIVAGIPYGCAKNLSDALQCMSTGHPSTSPVVGLGPSVDVPPLLVSASSSLCFVRLPVDIHLLPMIGVLRIGRVRNVATQPQGENSPPWGLLAAVSAS